MTYTTVLNIKVYNYHITINLFHHRLILSCTYEHSYHIVLIIELNN